MKTIFNEEHYREMTYRIQSIKPDSVRQWGSMTAAQMFAHCTVSVLVPAGKEPVKIMFLAKIAGGLFKKIILAKNDFRKNAPTAPNYKIDDSRDFNKERDRLLAVLEDFQKTGASVCSKYQHPLAGKMTADEWGRLVYKHIDHHLQQFSA